MRHWAYRVTQVSEGAGDVSVGVGQPVMKTASATNPQDMQRRRNEANLMTPLLEYAARVGLLQRGRTFSARGPLGP